MNPLAIHAGAAHQLRAAHLNATVFGGGWGPVVAAACVLAAGVFLRSWAILTLGRLFKFVVVIQADPRVVASGPYRLPLHRLCQPHPAPCAPPLVAGLGRALISRARPVVIKTSTRSTGRPMRHC